MRRADPDATVMRAGRLLAAGLAVLASALLAGCAASAASAAARAAPGGTVEVGPGVYMVQGAAGEVDADNLGRIGNAGFIVGDLGVLAIDTGTSYRHGVALLAAIRGVTDKPVRLAIVTHTRQEFLFGATAYRERGVPIQMHRQAVGLMQARCERCLKTLNQLLGAEQMQGTALWTPDHAFEASHTIDAIGRRVRVLHFGHSSGPGDVAVLDEASGVLFAGGLLDHQRIPDVQDSDLDSWAAALRALRTQGVRAIVPGHGPVASTGAMGAMAAIDATERYLVQLRTRLLALLQSGAALSEVPDASALPEFAHWDQYETIHRRNASILFVRFEREQMFKQAGSKE